MIRLSSVLVLIVALHCCYAAPVTKEEKESSETDISKLGIEYHRYLKEVVDALESDADFRKKLETADEEHIKSGQIAHELEFVSHHVRTKLDEIKRIEIDRLNKLVEKKRQLMGESNYIDDPNHKGHLDHDNPHKFEIEDLKRLIAKTTADLSEVDKKRREGYKQYELQKEYEKQDKLNHTKGDEHEKLEKQYKEIEEKQKHHEKLHEPGHKAQLEEIWRENDQMDQEFDARAFFALHDVDQNGVWDENEVKTLFTKELEKLYFAGAPEDILRQRAEEMERMREKVFDETDFNGDRLIDFHEFQQLTLSKSYQRDNEWQTLDEDRTYTEEELQQFIREHQGGYQVPQGQFHPGQMPQQHPQQLYGQLHNMDTNEIHGNYPQYPVPPEYHHQQQYQPQQHQPPQYQQQYHPPQQQHYQPHQQQYQQPQHQPPQAQQNQPPQHQQQFQAPQHQQNQPPQTQQQYQPPQTQQNQPPQHQQQFQTPQHQQQNQPPQHQQQYQAPQAQQNQPPPNQQVPQQPQVNNQQQNPSSQANIPQNNQQLPKVDKV